MTAESSERKLKNRRSAGCIFCWISDCILLTCPYTIKSCSEEIQLSDQKEITSPNYGENNTYPIGVTCQWLITSPFGKVVQLEILDFEVEYHPFCIWDYLGVAEGSCQVTFKTRYCGSIQQVPSKIMFDSSKVCIKFVSDYVYPKRGFRLLLNFKAASESITPTTPKKDLTTSRAVTFGNQNEVESGTDYSSPSDGLLENDNQPLSDTSFLLPPSTSSILSSASLSSSFSPQTLAVPSNVSEVPTELVTKLYTENRKTSQESVLQTTTLSDLLLKSASVTMTRTSPSSFISKTERYSEFSYSISPSSSTESIPPSSPSKSASIKASKSSLSSDTTKSQTSFHSSTIASTSSTSRTTGVLCAGSKNIWVSSQLIISCSVTDSGVYSPNTDCSISFQTDETNVLKAEFISFDLEHHPDCLYDRLSVYDGNDGQTEVANMTLCGSIIPGIFISSGPGLILRFVSDHIVQRTGFKAKITAIPKSTAKTTPPLVTDFKMQEVLSICSDQENVLISSDIFIQTPNYGLDTVYPLSISCTLSLDTLPGKKLRLEFIDFEVESAQDCKWDSFSVYDGSDQGSLLLGKYCGYKLPEPVQTSGHKMYLEFISDQYVRKRGVKCRLSVISDTTSPGTKVSGLGITKTADSGSSKLITESSISIKNLTGTHKSLQTDVTISPILAASSNMIQCSSKAIFNHSGVSITSSKTTNTVTGSLLKSAMIPQPFTTSSSSEQSISSFTTSSGSEQTISSSLNPTPTDSTKAESTSKDAPLHIDICAETEMELKESFYLLSPGKESNLNYPLNIECAVHITSATHKPINLEFLEFDVEYHSSCLWDYLEILDKSNQMEFHELGKFCGQKIPHSIQSSSSDLKLVFHSDSVIPKSGFKLYIDTADADETSSTPFSVSSGQLTSSSRSPGQGSTFNVQYPHSDSLKSTVTSTKFTAPVLIKSSTGRSVSPTAVPSSTNDAKYVTSPENLAVLNSTSSASSKSSQTPTISTKDMVSSIISSTTTQILPTNSVLKYLTGSTASLPEEVSQSVSATETSVHDSVTDNYTSIYDICNVSKLEVQDEINIISPGKNTDSNYPLNLHCAMELSCGDNERFRLEFVDFDIEYHSSCVWDFLEVLQKNGSNWVTLKRYCGTELPDRIRSTSPFIKIVFHSDYVVPKTGFKIEIKIEATNLHSSSTGASPRQLITTTPTETAANVPDTTLLSTLKYPVILFTENNQDMTFNLTEHSVFNNNALEEDDTEQGDLADNGVKTENIKLPIIPVLTPAFKTSIIPTISSTNNANVPSEVNGTVFSKNIPTQTHAASFAGNTKSPLSSDTESTTSLRPSNTKLSSQNVASFSELSTPMPVPSSTSDVLSDACLGEKSLTLLARSGYITSPGFDLNQPYPPNISCNWEIEDKNNERIMILFQSFNVEKSKNCRWDKLSIFEEAPFETRQLGVFCGSNIPPTITSSKKLRIQFQSDTVVETQGFKLQYIKTNGLNESFRQLSSTMTCPAGKAPCYLDNSCIPVEWHCDGEPDCDGGEDEKGCGVCSDSEFSCGDGTCIPLTQTCSGIAQCPYNLDEIGCVTKTEDGSINIRQNGSDYSLCYSNQMSSENLDAICKSAGYRFSISSREKTNNERDTVYLLNTNTTEALAFETRSCNPSKVTTIQCHDQECGQREIIPIHRRIIGGNLASPGEWPWVVAVQIGKHVSCGGTIISDQWVVTAGHCIDTMVQNPLNVSIVAGMTDINSSDRQVRVVTEIQLHPDYDLILDSDIALLRLQQPLHLGQNVKTVCLPWDKREFSPSSYCFIAGWGINNTNNYSMTAAQKNLHHAKTKIVATASCRSVYSHMIHIKDSMICAGYAGGEIDACKGDSGGPLMCETGSGRWTLAGIVSWGDMCGSFNKPGVYTKVSPFLPWIDLILGRGDTSNASCTFESSDWCGYVEMSGETFMWSRRTAGKNLAGHPTKDHTYGNATGHYIYADSVPPRLSSHARSTLQSPQFVAGDFVCLKFTFAFWGPSNSNLSVYGMAEFEEIGKLIWRVRSHLTEKNKWKETEVFIPSEISRLKFVVDKFGRNSGIGIDDVLLSPNSCEALKVLRCSFDDGTFCSYGHMSENNNPFAIKSKKKNNSDLYAAVNGNMEDFDFHSKSVLLSPFLPKLFDRLAHCLKFKFKVNMESSKLTVLTYREINGNLLNKKVLWTSSINGGVGWSTALVDIPIGHYNRLVFEGNRRTGATDNVSIAIDDIKWIDGNCF